MLPLRVMEPNLNPCSNGITIQTWDGPIIRSLNPYYHGMKIERCSNGKVFIKKELS